MLYPMGVWVNNLVLLWTYTETEQLSKWMADSGNQVSHYWSASLWIKHGKEARIIHIVMD